MRFGRSSGNRTSGGRPFTSLIDVVFLLLIFFLLTLKVIAPEGDFTIQMPRAAANEAAPEDPLPTEIRIRLVAGEDGSLVQLKLGMRELGRGPEAFARLNREMDRLARFATVESPLEVEIAADYQLDYEHIVKAIGACSGRRDKQGKLIRYHVRIKFAPPAAPKE